MQINRRIKNNVLFLSINFFCFSALFTRIQSEWDGEKFNSGIWLYIIRKEKKTKTKSQIDGTINNKTTESIAV